MIRIVEDMRDVNIYLSLRKQVGWIKLDENQAQRALNNSVKVFTVYDDDKPIGMGRVVGDMAVISYIVSILGDITTATTASWQQITMASKPLISGLFVSRG